MKSNLFLGLLLLATFVTFNAYGHKDTDFTIQPDGTLLGFPSKYGPAKIKIENKDSAKISIQIGTSLVDLPHCITKLFSTENIKGIWVGGSWYHGNWFLRLFVPPYLGIHLPIESGYYSIMFNMRNMKFMEMSKTSEKFNETTNFTEVSSSIIKLKKICSNEEIQQLSPSMREI